MDNKTVQYKRTLRGSVGSGVGALFNGNGRRYFILEHKDASKYHKAGESQKIIIDQIEIGRDSNCQVRFDESFSTVSRRHAAIIKDGERWKLVQLSTTNSTFLNGKQVEKEWYLENGDEIQLSIGGPRMGFIVPAGKQSLVSSIKMTERLELFRKQALRPYKTAIACLAVLLAIAIASLGTWNIMMQKDFNSQIAQAKTELNKLKGHNAELDTLLAIARKEQIRQDSLLNIYKNRPAKVVYPDTDGLLSSLLTKAENDVFFIRTTKVVVTDGEESVEIPNYGWVATGFLCADGRFITAKHCIEGWKFKGGTPSDDEALGLCAFAMNTSGVKIVAYLEAKSKNKVLHFKSTDFTMSNATERAIKIADNIVWHFEQSMQSDWAYIQTDIKGGIVVDTELSMNLPTGIDLHVLGFPHGWGAIDTSNFNPLYGSCKTSRAGLDNGVIQISARNYESGNSGGPVMYNDKGVLKAVGIVSYSRIMNDGTESAHGGICAISNLQ